VDEAEGNLLNAIGQRYLTRRLPCAFQMPSIRVRLDFIKNLIKEFAVDGVIWYQLKNCETYNTEAFYVNEKLKEAGIPFLKIESEYETGEIEGMRTRIETFVETIRGK
jgi:benzoyl-CoA reductase/2-hydroxyglutaryl-CoA dehydratase subunit BcrC/BadD/HgdB